jgi:hypothetical protein
MYMLRVEHEVSDFDAWKKRFDGDLSRRKEAGVRRHRVVRPLDNPKHVIVDMELDTEKEAEALLASLRGLWGQLEGVVKDPHERIVKEVETKDY